MPAPSALGSAIEERARARTALGFDRPTRRQHGIRAATLIAFARQGAIRGIDEPTHQ